MMRTLLAFLLALVFGAPRLAPADDPQPESAPAWKIDAGLKMHAAYFREGALPAGTEQESIPALRLTEASLPFAPDIVNITLQGIRGLGFPLPDRDQPERYAFYLKFYQFPRFLSQQTTARTLFARFRLNGLPGFQVLPDFAARKGNMVVKMGYIDLKDRAFTEKAPFPPLTLAREPMGKGKDAVPPQEAFDAQLPFASIYLSPTAAEPEGLDPDAKARFSAGGVLALHQDLLTHYAATLRERPAKDQSAQRSFQAPAEQRRTDKGLTTVWPIIDIMATPLVFENYKDLPMPHDPQRMFLTSLLLLRRTEYVTQNPKADPSALALDSPEFAKSFTKGRVQMLEMGSAVRF